MGSKIIPDNPFNLIIERLYNGVLDPDDFKAIDNINIFFKNFLVDQQARIPYTLITSHIYHDQNFYSSNKNKSEVISEDVIVDEKLDQVDGNIESLLGRASSDDLSKVINKIGDHIKLAIIQLHYIKKTTKSVAKETGALKEQLKDAQEQADEIRESRAKIYAEFVSILGIFTGIVIGIIGSFQTINSVFSNLNGVHTAKLLVFSSLTSAGVIIILFLLMQWISSIVLKGLGKDNNESIKEKIEKDYLFLFSMLTLAYIFVLGGLMYFSGLHKFLKHLFNKQSYSSFLALSLPIVIAIISYNLFKKKKLN